MTNLKSLLKIYYDLPNDGKKSFISNVISSPYHIDVNIYSQMASYNSIIYSHLTKLNSVLCPHCKHDRIVKNGHTDGRQRYKCRNCGKTFILPISNVHDDTKKNRAIWNKYINCMMEGFGVSKAAAICDITHLTAFRMRMKILDALQNMQNSVNNGHISHTDETYFQFTCKECNSNMKAS